MTYSFVTLYGHICSVVVNVVIKCYEYHYYCFSWPWELWDLPKLHSGPGSDPAGMGGCDSGETQGIGNNQFCTPGDAISRTLHTPAHSNTQHARPSTPTHTPHTHIHHEQHFSIAVCGITKQLCTMFKLKSLEYGGCCCVLCCMVMQQWHVYRVWCVVLGDCCVDHVLCCVVYV